jgi:hypothetical protein
MHFTHALRVAREVMRNVFAREALEETPASAVRDTAPHRSSLARLAFESEPLGLEPEAPRGQLQPGIIGLLVARESLPLDPEDPPRIVERGRFVRALFVPEPLPQDPEEPFRDARRGGIARALFVPEPLPQDPEEPPRASRRRGEIARALFVPEPLPQDPEEPPRPARSRWLQWLLVPETLDPSQR